MIDAAGKGSHARVGPPRGETPATAATAARRRRPRRPRRDAGDRGDRGETLALLVLWPALLVAILLLLVHAFIVTNAQSEAEVAASAGLRAAWRRAANEDFLSALNADGEYTDTPYTDPDLHADPHPMVLEMARDAQDAVARAAATDAGWRWWTPGAAEVQSDWCDDGVGRPDVADDRPGHGEAGWVRVVVSGEVFGPLAALWPDRLDTVYAAATGPAVLATARDGPQSVSSQQVPAYLPTC